MVEHTAHATATGLAHLESIAERMAAVSQQYSEAELRTIAAYLEAMIDALDVREQRPSGGPAPH